jgi:uncharacterized coiled-coil protein SlyX
MRQNGIIKDEVFAANIRIAKVITSIDSGHADHSLPLRNYKVACSELNNLFEDVQSLIQLHSDARAQLNFAPNPDCRCIATQKLMQLTSDLNDLEGKFAFQEEVVEKLLQLAIVSKRKLSVANSVHRKLLNYYSVLFDRSIELSGKAVRVCLQKLKLRYKAIS